MDTVPSGKNYVICCRTCLDDGSEEMYDIFEHCEDSVNIVEMLSRYTSIRVIINDQLPKNVCSNCYRQLLSFHNFTNAALNVDTQLKEYYLSLQPELVKQECNNIKNANICNEESELPIKEEIDVDENLDYNNLDDNLQSNIFIETKMINHSKKKLVRKRKMKDRSIFDGHILPYTKEYNCTQCTAKFKGRRCYLQHITKHNRGTEPSLPSEVEQNQSIICEICSISFNSIQSLSAHKKVHIAKDRVLQCTLCSKVFKKYSHLKRHELSSAHKDNHPFKCVLCKKTYATEDSLVAHVNMHNGVKSHHCPVCLRMFCHLRTLRNHIKVHTQEKPYLCPTCGKMFESSTNLNQHMKRHTGEKLFACNLCPRTFVSKGELKSHGLTHSGEKSFTCDQCNRGFTKRSSLEKHKLTHLGVKPYQCDVCGMKFVDKNHLKRHYRIHTGEKPYRCEICDRAFAQSNDLLKHKRIHLGNNLYKCDECNQSFRLKMELRQHISDHFISAKLNTKIDINTKDDQTLEEKQLQVVQPNNNNTPPGRYSTTAADLNGDQPCAQEIL